ncbi:MAG TPA: LysM peptidoglycan-binding domain-containing protein, partial [Tepidisphaeraceae bacterium]
QVVVGGPVIPAVPTPAPMAEIPTQPTQADNASPAAPQHTQAPADPFANDPLALDARNQGEPIISILPPEPVKTIAPIPAPSMAANNVREYKAQAGDTLSRIAALLPGGSTPANRDAVIKLNPTLQKDPNKVIAGRTYLLPTDKSLSAAAKKEIKPQTVRVIKAETKTTETRTYIVKRGDTLTKIASEQLGSVKEVQAIRDLNSDVLKGDVVKIDMKLKLPARSVATAN